MFLIQDLDLFQGNLRENAGCYTILSWDLLTNVTETQTLLDTTPQHEPSVFF